MEGRDIFKEERDYQRFIHCLYEFNDQASALPYKWLLRKKQLLDIKRPREILVKILCYCLMPNHFHLILQQIVDGGITKFMRKLGTGWTMYFNEKYQRGGVLFQGKFKSIIIDKDEYMMHLSRYIHLNPLELNNPNWKEEGINDLEKARNFLKIYRWSSFKDYIGIKNFPSVIEKDFILNFFKDAACYESFVFSLLAEDLPKIKDLTLE
ncbi:MAG: transposase [Candidatus Omnitrophica bacterium]|nr:transposase [Candidatus Omnitrophota bacterium]